MMLDPARRPAPDGRGSVRLGGAMGEAVAEAPGLVAGLDDVRAVGEPIDDGLGESGSGKTFVDSPNAGSW